MKKVLIVTMAMVMSFMMVFAFTACGSSEPSPEDQAVQSLDKILTAFKSADIESFEALLGDDNEMNDSVEDVFGSDENMKATFECVFKHFDYTIGTPEVVDESNINIPVTVTNTDMSQAVTLWFTDLLTYAKSNQEIVNDQDALQDLSIKMLSEGVDKTAASENGMVTNDVVFPMILEGGEWKMNSETIDISVFDAIMGGFITALTNIAGDLQ